MKFLCNFYKRKKLVWSFFLVHLQVIPIKYIGNSFCKSYNGISYRFYSFVPININSVQVLPLQGLPSLYILAYGSPVSWWEVWPFIWSDPSRAFLADSSAPPAPALRGEMGYQGLLRQRLSCDLGLLNSFILNLGGLGQKWDIIFISFNLFCSIKPKSSLNSLLKQFI